MKGSPVAAVEQAVGTGVRSVRVLTRDSLHPIPQWSALEGCTAAVLMTEHDDAKQASGQCARVCGALTRVRRACLWRAQRVCATPLPQGGVTGRSSAREQRDVAVCLTSSAASAFVDTDQMCSSPLAAHRSTASVSLTRSGGEVCVCCFVLLNRYWGIVTVPGSIPYGSRPGVAGSSPSTLTTSLDIPVPSSSSSNGPTTVPLTTMGLSWRLRLLGRSKVRSASLVRVLSDENDPSGTGSQSLSNRAPPTT